MQIFAHRGASSEAPENTLIAFSKAIEIGVDFIELDIHISKDKEIVVIHDENTLRTTGQEGNIKKMTLAEIKKLNCGNEEYGAEIPTLEETINLTKDKINLQIEIKSTRLIDPLMHLLKKYDILHSVLISSFNHRELFKIQKIDPSIKMASLEPTGVGWILNWVFRKGIVNNAINNKFYAIHPLFKIANQKMVNYAHENGIKVNVWTIDRKRWIEKFAGMGVDGIITNNPRFVKDLLINKHIYK